jgi:hypothetical protein
MEIFRGVYGIVPRKNVRHYGGVCLAVDVERYDFGKTVAYCLAYRLSPTKEF